MIWVLTGPECSGKTSLAQQLHTYFGWPLVPELARDYLNERHTQSGSYRYRPSDLLALAAKQERTEAQLGADAILDTDLLTLIIWWQEKYGPVPRAYLMHWQRQFPRRYLLCKPDVPWQHDPQRENPTDRDRLFARYQLELRKRQCHFTVCQGSEAERLERAVSAVSAVSAMQNLS